MSKDDFHVIAYKILRYLYKQIKNGKAVDVDRIMPENSEFVINESYWEFILTELATEGYIAGISIKQTDRNQRKWIDDLDRIQITMKGIEYLYSDGLMKKVMEQETGVKTIC